MNFRHGKCHSRVYAIWASIKSRCLNPNVRAYSEYGGRGIDLCAAWHDFRRFYADMGDPPRGFSIERIDNDRGYSPDNCTWAPRATQNRNKRDNHRVTARGETLTIAEWAERSGLKYATLHQRIRKGWDPERAIFSPLVPHRDRKWSRKAGAEHGVMFDTPTTLQEEAA